ncbi:hypothetical protein GOP47_0005854 [Adiantum capillus-veneris]|uniref:Uncharacterized protein n=1 Tax=Adiantum capillus-veneris TaxID=13818 RepID=A0A9D4V6J0_ADICA|nr:hypothetical protein GOP47_0005854 [Adiantum capillus-veneris]
MCPTPQLAQAPPLTNSANGFLRQHSCNAKILHERCAVCDRMQNFKRQTPAQPQLRHVWAAPLCDRGLKVKSISSGGQGKISFLLRYVSALCENERKECGRDVGQSLISVSAYAEIERMLPSSLWVGTWAARLRSYMTFRLLHRHTTCTSQQQQTSPLPPLP